jgi:hypothetical protein
MSAIPFPIAVGLLEKEAVPKGTALFNDGGIL